MKDTNVVGARFSLPLRFCYVPFLYPGPTQYLHTIKLRLSQHTQILTIFQGPLGWLVFVGMFQPCSSHVPSVFAMQMGKDNPHLLFYIGVSQVGVSRFQKKVLQEIFPNNMLYVFPSLLLFAIALKTYSSPSINIFISVQYTTFSVICNIFSQCF